MLQCLVGGSVVPWNLQGVSWVDTTGTLGLSAQRAYKTKTTGGRRPISHWPDCLIASHSRLDGNHIFLVFVPAMAAISFTFGAEFEEYPELPVRISPTFLIACMLNCIIYAAYRVLSRDSFWSLAHEDLNDYEYELLKAFQDDDVCCICQDEFRHSSHDSNELCSPILIQPCAHVVGDRCFKRRIASYNDTRHAGGMRCPHCSQPVSRKPQSLHRRIARIIATSILALMSINFALLHFDFEDPTPTEEDHARMLQRRRLFNRYGYGMHCLLAALWLFDVLTALLMLADALQIVGGMTHLTDVLAQLAELVYDQPIECIQWLVITSLLYVLIRTYFDSEGMQEVRQHLMRHVAWQ